MSYLYTPKLWSNDQLYHVTTGEGHESGLVFTWYYKPLAAKELDKERAECYQCGDSRLALETAILSRVVMVKYDDFVLEISRDIVDKMDTEDLIKVGGAVLGWRQMDGEGIWAYSERIVEEVQQNPYFQFL